LIYVNPKSIYIVNEKTDYERQVAMSVAEIKALVRRYVDEPLNKGNFAVWDELCAPEHTVRNLADNTVQSREDQKRFFLQTRTNYPDYKTTIEEIIVEGDRLLIGGR
jgi:SnoaL-like domain